MPFLSVFSDSLPTQTVRRGFIVARAYPVCVGREKLLFGSQAEAGPPPLPPLPLKGAVRPCSAAVLPFLMSGVEAHRHGDICTLAPVPLRGCCPGSQPLLLLLHSCCSDYISNKRKPSYHAGRLLYSCSGEPGPTSSSDFPHWPISEREWCLLSRRKILFRFCSCG